MATNDKVAVMVTRDPDDENIGVRFDDDDKPLVFEGGKAQQSVTAGSHILTYVVFMPPGTSVTLAITAPPEAVWKKKLTVPDDGIVAGFKKLMIS